MLKLVRAIERSCTGHRYHFYRGWQGPWRGWVLHMVISTTSTEASEGHREVLHMVINTTSTKAGEGHGGGSAHGHQHHVYWGWWGPWRGVLHMVNSTTSTETESKKRENPDTVCASPKMYPKESFTLVPSGAGSASHRSHYSSGKPTVIRYQRTQDHGEYWTHLRKHIWSYRNGRWLHGTLVILT